MNAKRRHQSQLEWVALLLAVGISTALNLLVLAVTYTAIFGHSDVPGGLSENATQILTGWGGGMIGVLGAYVGYKAGATKPPDVDQPESPESPEP